MCLRGDFDAWIKAKHWRYVDIEGLERPAAAFKCLQSLVGIDHDKGQSCVVILMRAYLLRTPQIRDGDVRHMHSGAQIVTAHTRGAQIEILQESVKIRLIALRTDMLAAIFKRCNCRKVLPTIALIAE